MCVLVAQSLNSNEHIFVIHFCPHSLGCRQIIKIWNNMFLIASNLFNFLAMKVYVILHRNFGKLNLVTKKVEKGIHSPNLRFTKPNNTEVSAQGVHCIFIIAVHRLNANFMEYFLSFLYSICCSAILKKSLIDADSAVVVFIFYEFQGCCTK